MNILCKNALKLLLIFVPAILAACGGGSSSGTTGGSSLSSNANLSGLTLSAGDLDQIFQTSQTDYTATVKFLEHAATITATTEDANASVKVNGTAVTSAQPSQQLDLAAGANTQLNVEVTAEDGTTTKTYTIDVLRQAATAFAQEAYVKASNTDQDDLFGSAVALSGDTLAVAAYQEDSSAGGMNPSDDGNDATNGLNYDAGAVYVFTRDAGGTWSQQAYIKASNPDKGDNFGYSLALSGDTLAVGAIYEDSSASGVNPSDDGNDVTNGLNHDAGAVYVFTRDTGGTWSQQAYIKASNPDKGDWFGYSLALSGDTLAVGARNEDSAASGVNPSDDGNDVTNGLNYNAGAVYVFTHDAGGTWSQQSYVKASNPGQSDFFGWSVALAGDTLAVGATYESSDATGVGGDENNDLASAAGAVYVFTRDAGGTWSQQGYVKASNTDQNDQFGTSVALSGDTLAVGAPQEDSNATGVNPADDGNDPTNATNHNAGAAYVFTRNISGGWSQQAYLKASNTGEADRFGYSLALVDGILAIGAYHEESNAMGVDGDQTNNADSGAGAVYLFGSDANGIWTQQAYVKASNTDPTDNFGSSVALTGDTLAVGAPSEDSDATGVDGDGSNNLASNSGAVYIRR